MPSIQFFEQAVVFTVFLQTLVSITGVWCPKKFPSFEGKLNILGFFTLLFVLYFPAYASVRSQSSE
jgi:hypothetical protein